MVVASYRLQVTGKYKLYLLLAFSLKLEAYSLQL